MKRFLKDTIIFFTIITFGLYLIQYTVWKNPLFFKFISHRLADTVYKSIFYSKKKSNKKTLVFGDSVGRQLFMQGSQSNFYSVASTQAVTMIGQYILMRNYCERNAVDTVVLVYHPSSFQNNLDLKYTYAHFIKTFYFEKNFKYITPYAKELINNIPYVSISQIPYVKMTNWIPRYKYKDDLDYSQFFISKIAIEYLKKIDTYCKENNIVFYIISPPLRKDIFQKVSISYFTSQIKVENLEQIFKYYFDSMTELPQSDYVDYMHFTKEGRKHAVALIVNSKTLPTRFGLLL